MCDWLLRMKKNAEGHMKRGWKRQSLTPKAETDTQGKVFIVPWLRSSSRRRGRRHDMAQRVAEVCVMPHRWGVLEIYPLPCWAKVSIGRYLLGHTLRSHLRGVPGKAAGCWGLQEPWCWQRRPCVGVHPVKIWKLGNNPFPPAASLQDPPVRELQCQLAKKKYCKGPDQIPQSRQKRMNLEQRGNKSITDTWLDF